MEQNNDKNDVAEPGVTRERREAAELYLEKMKSGQCPLCGVKLKPDPLAYVCPNGCQLGSHLAKILVG